MDGCVLFLDIDGVLNHFGPRREPGGWNQLDRDKVDLLNQVVELTGCRVVISSSWRLGRDPGEKSPRDRIAYILAVNGYRGEVHDVTPRIPTEVSEALASINARCHVERGLEIGMWIEANGFRGTFAIVDDGSDMAHLIPRLVQTDGRAGLTTQNALDLVRLLREPPPRPPRSDWSDEASP